MIRRIAARSFRSFQSCHTRDVFRSRNVILWSFHVGLWDEVKDHLRESGAALSGRQQQRLCIARAIAVEPEVILMDEPCSVLDPISTARIEDLINSLRENHSIIIVTHNLQQAARVSLRTAFVHFGEMVEFGETAEIFANPRNQRTRGYITGRYG